MQNAAYPVTLAEALWPRIGIVPRDLLRDVALVLGFALLVTLCAQIAIRLPWTTAIKGGINPFIVGDMMILFLASLVLPSAWAVVNLRERRESWT